MFFLNGIDVLVLPAHSNQLLQMFDAAVAAPLKTAFKQELDWRILAFARKPAETEITLRSCGVVWLKAF
jgi:hypothetical protein